MCKNLSLLSADDNTSKTEVLVLLPLICWVILKFSQSIGMPMFLYHDTMVDFSHEAFALPDLGEPHEASKVGA